MRKKITPKLLTRLLALSILQAVLMGCSSLTGLAEQTLTPTPESAIPASTRAACRVTIPNTSTPPGEKPDSLYHGNGVLWTEFLPESTVIFRPGGPGEVEPDGSLAMKWPWWRGVRGNLTIEGQRLDATAPPLRADIPQGYGDSGFQATALIFPTEGCWQVTGKVGDASLTFVVLVVRE